METITVKQYNLEKVSNKMKKEFGSIPKGEEDNYSFTLSTMEGNLLKLHRQDPNRSGRRALTAIQMALLTVDGYIKQVEYDFSNHVTPENQALLNGLLMSFDPYTNPEIHELVIADNDSFEPKKYFSIPIKCLIRIEKSIELWTKKYGANGYFQFIENQLGKAVANDNQMNYTILAGDK